MEVEALDQEALDRIHRNLKRCRAHMGKLIPVSIYRRDVMILVTDCCIRFYGDLDFEGLEGDIKHRAVLVAMSGLPINTEEMLKSLQIKVSCPPMAYERNVSRLLHLRWRIMNGQTTRAEESKKMFVKAMIEEMKRLGAKRS